MSACHGIVHTAAGPKTVEPTIKQCSETQKVFNKLVLYMRRSTQLVEQQANRDLHTSIIHNTYTNLNNRKRIIIK
jgi:hypothetical protein